MTDPRIEIYRAAHKEAMRFLNWLAKNYPTSWKEYIEKFTKVENEKRP